MKNAALSGKPYAGTPHVRFEEGKVASAKPKRGALFYKLDINHESVRGAISVACLALMALYPCRGGDVVHRASHDFIVNQERENPCTNVLGGVWSYLCAPRGQLGDSAQRSFMLQKQSYAGGRIVGLGFYPSGQNYGVPQILANIAGNDVVDTSLSGGTKSPFLPADLLLHPGMNTNDAYGIIRFTVPRTGRYAVRFTYRTLVPDNGSVNVYAVTNGVTVFSQRLIRSARTDAYSVYATNDLAETSFAAGDIIETALEMDGAISCDGVLVDMVVTEKDDGRWYMPAEALAGDMATNTEQNGYSFSASRGEKYQTMAGTSVDNPQAKKYGTNFNFDLMQIQSIVTNAVTNVVEDVTNVVKTVTTNGVLLRVYHMHDDSFQPYPILSVNTNAAPFYDNNNILSSRALLPGEMLFHPGQKYPSMRYAFWPEEPGTFDFAVSARDLNSAYAKSAGSGVRVCLVRDQDVLAERTVSLEDPDLPSCATFFLTNVFLLANQRLELVVDNNGSIIADATGVKWYIRRRSTELPSGVTSLNAAFAACVASETPAQPFTDADGFTWESGKMTNVDKLPDWTTYARHSTWRSFNSDLYKGWSSGDRPFTTAYLGEEMMRAENFKPYGGGEGVGVVVPGEVVLHPGTKYVYNVVRATVPCDGVWDLQTLFRHLNEAYGDGIDATVCIRNSRTTRYAAYARQLLNTASYRLDASFACPALRLRAGDSVDFVVGPGPSGDYSYDLTGLQSFFTVSSRTGLVASVDFDAAAGASATFVGAGRVGADETMKWNSLEVTDGATSAFQKDLWLDGRRARTGITVTLTPSNHVFEADSEVGAENALLADGVACANTTNACGFVIGGLVPGEIYTLVAYGSGEGLVTVAGRKVGVWQPWFSRASECAMLDVEADAEGRVTGQFCASSDRAPARFSGLQIMGTRFSEYVPNVTLVIVR